MEAQPSPEQLDRVLAAARENAAHLATRDRRDDDSGFDAHARTGIPSGSNKGREGIHGPANDAETGIPSGSSGGDPLSHRSFPAPLSIPGYLIIREVHRGGQGIVYQAVRESTGDDVAIKVLHDRRAASPRELERFEREAEVLRELNHPNLIAVSEIGVTDGESGRGRPFLVMPYIPGWPLDEHVRRNDLSVRETLALFAKICEAVNAAHLNGVIHRDLKPSNIRIDDAGEPHVLDFGLAKSTTSAPAESLTETGQFVGSLPWASPEQADPSLGRVDVRTDVYSLGAVLYQLLTGTLPIDPIGSQREVLNRIVTAEPIRCGAVPARRDCQSKVDRIDSDVETIVHKCLEKDRTRRYSNAGDLASDLRNCLEGRPLEAKRDSAWYVLRKALRRHRAAATVAAAFVLLVTSAAVVFGFMYRSQSRERARAEEHKKLAENQRELAEKREKQTQQVSEFQAGMLSDIDVEAMGHRIKERFREQVQAALERQYVGEFPDRRKRTPDEIEAELAAFDHLADAAQAADVARGVMDKFVLGRAADALEERFADQPLVRAQLHNAIGGTYRELGLYSAAEIHLRKALEIGQHEPGEVDEYVLGRSLDQLARLLLDRSADDCAAAEPLLHQELALCRKLYGDESWEVADTLNALGQSLSAKDNVEAERLYREALAMDRKLLGDEHRYVSEIMHNLAMVLQDRQQDAEAEALYTEALAIKRKTYGHEHPSVARTLVVLGCFLRDKGQGAAAEPLFREALAIQRNRLGDEHPQVAGTLNHLAQLFEDKGDYAAAQQLRLEALTILRKRLGDEHSEVARNLRNLAVVLQANGEWSAAEQLFREVLAIRRKLLGDEHPDVALALNDLAVMLQKKGDLPAAEPLHLAALAMQRRLLPAGHVDLAPTLSGCALLLFNRRQYAEAESMLREALAIREKSRAQNSQHYRNDLIGLSRVLFQQEKYAEAENVARGAIETLRANAGRSAKDRDGLRGAVDVLAQTLVASGKADQAILVWRESVEDFRLLLPANDLSLASALAQLGQLLLQNDKYADAEPILRECLAIREQALAPHFPSYWFLPNTRSMLGGALAGQAAALIELDAPAAIAKFTEAEPLLVEAGTWLTQNADRVPENVRAERVRWALERIVKLYESWDTVAPNSGKAEQSATWRAELNKLPGP